MLKYLFYFFLFLNFIIVFRRKKIKIIEIINWIFLIILISGRCNGPDYGAYLNEYNRLTEIINHDIFYQILVNLGRFFHLDYNVFLFILVCISFGIIIYVVTKLNINSHIFIFFYMIFTVFYDAIQVNNFIANAFCILAVYMRINNKKIVSFALIIIASMIHAVSLIYLFIILFSLKNEQKNIICLRLFVVLGLLLFIACLFVSPILSMVTNIFYNILPNSDVGNYLDIRVNNGYVIFIFLHLMNIFILKKCKKNLSINITSNQMNFLNIVYFLNIVIILFYPLLLVNSNFYRIFRNYNILIFICYAIILSSYVIKSKNIYEKKYLSFLCCAIIVSMIWYHFEVNQNDYSYIVEPVIAENYFLGG